MAEASALLRFWFGDDLSSSDVVAGLGARWFRHDPELDAAIRDRFADLPERGSRGELEAWREAPQSALALVLVYDQLPRNLYRGSSRAFAYDDRALSVAEASIARGFADALHPVEATFLYLPFEHAEDAACQDRCVALFEALLARTPEALCGAVEGYLDYARRHREVIRRFGRFPHRNECLDRAHTDAEHRYLEQGGDVF